MTFSNPLDSLDELILEQFEKVTQAAHKHLGWDKYDLIKLTGQLGGLSYAATGIYSGIDFVQFRPNPANAIGCLFNLSAGYFIYQMSTRYSDINREKEMRILENVGVRPAPNISSIRPLMVGAGLVLLGNGIYKLMGYGQGDLSLMHLKVKGVLDSLIGTSMELLLTMDYFKETTLFPPSRHKVSVKSIYEAVKAKVLPKPVLEPVRVEAPHYATIDDALQ